MRKYDAQLLRGDNSRANPFSSPKRTVQLPFAPHGVVQTGAAQCGPDQPAEHVHLLGEPHVPWPQPPSQTAWSQFAPPQPSSHTHISDAFLWIAGALHVQVLGAVHLPLGPQPPLHIAVSQFGPPHPASQLQASAGLRCPASQTQVLGAVHLPLGPQPPTVLPLHTASLQSVPPHPASQVQTFGAEHFPCEPHDSSHAGSAQPGPEYPVLQHSAEAGWKGGVFGAVAAQLSVVPEQHGQHSQFLHESFEHGSAAVPQPGAQCLSARHVAE